MAAFQFKIKGYLSEPGEYTEFFDAEPGTILQFILQHWFNEALPNNLDIIVIKNGQGDQLVIDHVKRDIFEYFFLPSQQARKYFYRKTDIQAMFFLLESFFSSQWADIEANLKETDENHAWVHGEMIGKNFTYRIDRKRLWQNVNWLVYQLGVLLILLVSSIFIHVILLILVVVFIVVVLITNYSRIRLYQSYYADNREWQITISRAAENMEISNASWTHRIPKTDIRKLTRFAPPHDNAHAHVDFFLEIEFSNGDVLNLTSLLIAQADADGKFMHNLIPFETEVTDDGRLRRKTNLSHYFSAVGSAY